MKYYPLTVSGKTYKLRIVTRDHAELESILGAPVMDVLQDQSRLMKFDTLTAFLFVASRPFKDDNGGALDRDKACKLVDDLIDEGKTLEHLIQIVIGICEASGFFPTGTAAAMEQAQSGEPEGAANPMNKNP